MVKIIFKSNNAYKDHHTNPQTNIFITIKKHYGNKYFRDFLCAHFFAHILLDFQRFQKVHMKILHILPHPQNTLVFPCHTKNNF